MNIKHPLKNAIIIILTAFIAILILILLGFWTGYISRSQERDNLRRAMEAVIETEGEKKLFEMAGISVDDIYYSDEGLELYQTGNSGAWKYTAEEARKIAVYSTSKDKVVQILGSAELSDSGQGSGVIVSQDGYIVTNKHVIGSGSSFTVNFYDGSTATADLVGYDELTDIAIIKINGKKNLPFIEFGSSSDLVVGQTVMAIGNPYGYTWSLTSGNVSGLERMVSTSSGNVIPNMIQTDALINPGNSGGPLLNGSGEMVGLISSIYSTSGSAQGISFALPAETVKDVVSEIIENGTIHRGWLDILSIELNAQIVAHSKLNVDHGILVSQVVPAGRADRGGLKGGSDKAQYGQSVIYLGGDIIIKINDKEIRDYTDYFSALFSTKAGDKVDVTVNRKGTIVVLEDVELVEQTEENTRWILR